MKIQDQDHARNWAQAHLKYPFVLVDEDGNTHCLNKVGDAVAVADQKEAGKKKYYMVKGTLPDKIAKPNDDAVK